MPAMIDSAGYPGIWGIPVVTISVAVAVEVRNAVDMLTADVVIWLVVT